MAIFNLLLLALFATCALSASITASPYVDAADQAFKIFMTSMYNPDKLELRLSVMSKDPSSYWNTAVAFQSLLNYHNLKQSVSGDETVVIPLIYQLLETEVTLNQCDAQLRNNYNDDMSWMIHGLTALYDHTKNQSLVDRSISLHQFVRTSEDTTCCGDMKGGIWWDRTHTQKATAAQAGSVLAALRIRESDHSIDRESWLNWAIAHYDFWLYHMVNQTDYAVCDNIDTKGERRWWSFTYNEGLMLADAVHLYQATNDSRFLNDADRFTQRLIDESVTVSIPQSVYGPSRTGQVLQDDGSTCSGDTAQFHQVSYQYLTQYYNLLLELANNPSTSQSKLRVKANVLYQFLKDNIDSLLLNAFNEDKQTYNCNWSGPFQGGQDGLQGAMNSAVSSISLFASLQSPPSLNKREMLMMKFE